MDELHYLLIGAGVVCLSIVVIYLAEKERFLRQREEPIGYELCGGGFKRILSMYDIQRTSRNKACFDQPHD